MKSFYEWYRKHITGAIFGGLILGILTGLFLAGRFKSGSDCNECTGKHLYECIEHDDLPAGILFDSNGYCKHRKCQDDR